MYRYCANRGIPHRKCGKLVVATNEKQLPALGELHKQAKLCGVGGVRVVDSVEANEMEPEVRCTKVMQWDVSKYEACGTLTTECSQQYYMEDLGTYLQSQIVIKSIHVVCVAEIS